MPPLIQRKRWPEWAEGARQEVEALATDTTRMTDEANDRLKKAVRLLKDNPEAAEILIVYAMRDISELKANQERIRRLMYEAKFGS